MSEYKVYFNDKKEAFAHEIENSICSIDYDVWTQYAGTNKWDIINGEFVDVTHTEAYKKEQEEKELFKIYGLKMTALDLINYISEKKKLTLKQINTFLESNLDLKMQLTYCQFVYCGVVCELCPITISSKEITKEDVIEWFIDKNNSL